MEGISFPAALMYLAINKTLLRNPEVPPFFQYSQQNSHLFIYTDGSKSERRRSRNWNIALECSTRIISGYISNFGQICAINPYRAEVYASLVVTLFLYLYSTYYLALVNIRINASCNNQDYVDKLTWLLEDDYHHHSLHKILYQKKVPSYYTFFPDIKIITKITMSETLKLN